MDSIASTTAAAPSSPLRGSSRLTAVELVHHAIQFIDEGSTSFAHGHMDAALLCFQCALGAISTAFLPVFTPAAVQCQLCTARWKLKFVSNHSSGCGCTEEERMLLNIPNNFPNGCISTGKLYDDSLCSRVLSFDKSANSSSDPHCLSEGPTCISQDDIIFLRAVIAYNIGLTLHQRLQGGAQHHRESDLVSAISFYNYCIDHLRFTWRTMAYPDLLISVLNNLIQVYLDLSLFETALHLTQVLVAAASKQTNPANDLLSEEEERTVHLNVFITRLFTNAPAA